VSDSCRLVAEVLIIACIVLRRTSVNGVVVTIGEAICAIQTVNATAITCVTGASEQTNLQAPVRVFVNGSGYANSAVQFQYIDLWSSKWTWDGADPPEAGSIVTIDKGVKIFLDIATPILRSLVIDNASLIFDDLSNVTLNVEYIIIVNGGLLQIGTESTPFQHRGVIKLYGHLRSIELPICE
jgi:hypothetical protein